MLLIAIVASALASFWLVGSTIYGWVGLIVGIIAATILLYRSRDDHAPGPIWLMFSLVVGSLLGLLWPGAVIALSWNGERPRASTGNAEAPRQPTP